MSNLGNSIEAVIEQTVKRVLAQEGLPDSTYIETDNLGEIIEKLAIIHIRMWMIEDAIHAAKTDAEIADLKRKSDICFKVKRPRYVEAINLMVDTAIKQNRSLIGDSVKLYKGVDNG
jgi:hypothetical protein